MACFNNKYQEWDKFLESLSIVLFSLGLYWRMRYDTSFCNRYLAWMQFLSQNSFMERGYFAQETCKKIEEQVDSWTDTRTHDIFFKSLYFLKLWN